MRNFSVSAVQCRFLTFNFNKMGIKFLLITKEKKLGGVHEEILMVKIKDHPNVFKCGCFCIYRVKII